MEDVPQVAEKARMIGAFVRNIKQHLRASPVNWDAVNEAVTAVNALIIPRAWVGIDQHGRLHATYVWKDTARDQLYGSSPTELRYSADFVWSYRPWDGTVTCVKSRDGVSLGQTFLCNPPSGVVHSTQV